jgi:hypothetical protein
MVKCKNGKMQNSWGAALHFAILPSLSEVGKLQNRQLFSHRHWHEECDPEIHE